jgi:hypothetical protein
MPFWAFAVSVSHSGYAGTYRRPSESDLRWMQFSNLAYGAKGLWYFTYWGASALDGFAHQAIVSNTGAKTELWEMVRAINTTVLAAGDTLLGLTSVDVVHTKPPAGQKTFAQGERWINDIQAKDALIGYFEDASGAPYAFVVNKTHGKGQSAAAAADRIQLTLDPTVRALEAVSWLDGTTGPVAIQDGAASLAVAGGTGVLLKATLGDPPAPAPPPSSPPPGGGSSGGCRASSSPAAFTTLPEPCEGVLRATSACSLFGMLILGAALRRRSTTRGPCTPRPRRRCARSARRPGGV